MYFLSDEERRYVVRKLLPEARGEKVAEELRGWNWHTAPLAPCYAPRLGIYEIAGQYCPNGRDVYLRHVLGKKAAPNAAMVEGKVLHELVGQIILAAKRAIYRDVDRAKGSEQSWPDCLDSLEGLPLPELPAGNAVRLKAQGLWSWEKRRVLARLEDVLSRQSHIGPDALAALAIPLVVEQKLDGTFLGLSAHLSADAAMTAEPMMMDIKFGERKPFHRLTTTGYALVMESLYEYPIGLGCIVYPRFQDGRWIVERDFHLINDELRQWFIEARDERARLVEEEIDPKPGACYRECPYWNECHPA